MRIMDTMSKTLITLQPFKPGSMGIYTCGPTVYRDVHIGNLRSYLMTDWIKRSLIFNGMSVKHVKNITDVGHMRQEMLEQGEDKIIAAAITEGKTPLEISQFYTERFLADELKLNIMPADEFPRATEHIDEMIIIIKSLVDQRYAYEVDGTIYFSISKFPDYGRLSGNTSESGLKEGVRTATDPFKKDPRDFTLWKKAEPNRELKWSSPWGEGFPGWHIECSAMSMRYLGSHFEIHTGGVDNIFPHHEGEIAQSESYTGSTVVDCWVHGQHLLADGVKMAKSAGNSYTLSDIEAQDIDPLSFRYLCLTARYDTRLNFTFTSLKASQRALYRLRARVGAWMDTSKSTISQKQSNQKEWIGKLMERVNDNLDLPGALALTWNLTRADLDAQESLSIIKEFDQILGLNLLEINTREISSQTVLQAVKERTCLRETAYSGIKQDAEIESKSSNVNFIAADKLRSKISQLGYITEDKPEGTELRHKAPWERAKENWPTISSSAQATSFINSPDHCEFSLAIVANNYIADVSRCVQSVLKWSENHPVELVIVDNGSTDGTGEWLEQAASTEPSLRLIHTDHVLGEAAAKNVALKNCTGEIVIMLDTSVELTGNIFDRIQEILSNKSIGVVGPFGLKTDDLHHFHDEGQSESGMMDAMQSYCFAFRRNLLNDVGLMRESFRFYRNLDLDFSFHFKNCGYDIFADPSLKVARHEHRIWNELSENKRDELSRKNYGRFLNKWGKRSDLLVSHRIQ